MSQDTNSKNEFYFSTRDLLIMTVLAALGGVASTYINTISDAVQAAIGFVGGTQWAAGLHVLWIVLSVGILRKPGTGTITGILKGFVELLSGNSHGVIILLVDIVAGLLVDFGFLIFTKKNNLLPFIAAGGLATASNVLVFQVFATLPQNILGVTAVVILLLIAMVSGLIFAGLIPYGLVNSLARGGVIKNNYTPPAKRKIIWIVLVSISFLAAIFAVFLRFMYTGPEVIEVSGAVNNPIYFPSREIDLETKTQQMDYRGVLTKYTGFQLAEILEFADPQPEANTLLLQASDGYAFLLSFEEIENNPNILLIQNGRGKNASFDIVGPESSKAWVRSIEKLIVINAQGLEIRDLNGFSHYFEPDKWTNDMDSTQITLPDSSEKLQGVPVWKILQFYSGDQNPNLVHFNGYDELITFSWTELDQNDDIRIFTRIKDNQINFILAEMSGELILDHLSSMEMN